MIIRSLSCCPASAELVDAGRDWARLAEPSTAKLVSRVRSADNMAEQG